MRDAICPICGRRYKQTKGKKKQDGSFEWWPKNQCGAHLQLKEAPK